MKRFFTLAAAALLTSVLATSTFAAWGPNGQFGVPVGPPVGQSSTPSTNPASAPITTPFNPNADLGAVPGSYKDPAVRAKHSQEWLNYREAKAKAAVEGKPFDKKNNSPRLHGGGFFGNDVLSRPTNYPSHQSQQRQSAGQPGNFPGAQPQHHNMQGGNGAMGYPGKSFPNNGGFGYGGSGMGKFGMYAR